MTETNKSQKTILGIDPSSTAAGCALLDEGGRLLDAWIIKPAKISAAPQFRIDSICGDIAELLGVVSPDIIVIEWTVGKVGLRRHKGQGAGLAIYGAAVGAVWQAVKNWARGKICEIVLIPENEWTRGVSKGQRTARISSTYPGYDLDADKGGDVADAIGIVEYFLRRKLLTVNW